MSAPRQVITTRRALVPNPADSLHDHVVTVEIRVIYPEGYTDAACGLMVDAYGEAMRELVR